MRLLKLNGCFLLQRFGMTGLVPRSCRSQLGAIVGLVAEHPFRRPHSANEALRDRAIVCFTSGQQDGDKASFNICECVNLRVALLPSLSTDKKINEL
jgi:hypothetical protein